MRCVVLPPVPVPYREPLFALLAERGRIGLQVVYQSGSQPGWDHLEIWRGWAKDVRGRGIESGHFLAEEAPEATLASLAEFLGPS